MQTHNFLVSGMTASCKPQVRHATVRHKFLCCVCVDALPNDDCGALAMRNTLLPDRCEGPQSSSCPCSGPPWQFRSDYSRGLAMKSPCKVSPLSTRSTSSAASRMDRVAPASWYPVAGTATRRQARKEGTYWVVDASCCPVDSAIAPCVILATGSATVPKQIYF